MIHCDPGRPAHWSTTARTKHWQSGYLKPALIRKTSVVNFSCSDGLSARGNPYTDTLYTHQPILIPIHVYIYYIYSHNMCMWLHICIDRLRFVKPWGSFWLVQLWGWLQHRKQPNGSKWYEAFHSLNPIATTGMYRTSFLTQSDPMTH